MFGKQCNPDRQGGRRNTRRPWLLLVVLVGVGPLTGCGGGGEAANLAPETLQTNQHFSGENRRVAAVIDRYGAAIRDGDVRRLCKDILSIGTRYGSARERRWHRCARDSGDLAREVRNVRRNELYRLVAKKIRIDGSRASATVWERAGQDRRADSFYLERRVGTWRIAARGVTPAHAPARRLMRLDCPRRKTTSLSVAMQAVRARSAKAFLKSYLHQKSRRGRARASLVLVGIDYKEATRSFEYQTRPSKVLGLFPVTGTNPYSIFHPVTFCATKAGPLPATIG